MHNAYTQAHHNLVCRVRIRRRDLDHLVVYVHTIAPTYHMSRRDRMCIRACKNSRDRSRRT
jgi:hypothetical protein